MPLARVHVAYVLIANKAKDRVLMVKNKETNGWSLPGGLVKDAETLEQAAIREVKEETGYEVTVSGIVAVNESRLRHREQVLFVTFRGEITGGREEVSRPDEILEIAWMDVSRADELMPYFGGRLAELVDANEVPYIDQGVIGDYE